MVRDFPVDPEFQSNMLARVGHYFREFLGFPVFRAYLGFLGFLGFRERIGKFDKDSKIKKTVSLVLKLC